MYLKSYFSSHLLTAYELQSREAEDSKVNRIYNS